MQLLLLENPISQLGGCLCQLPWERINLNVLCCTCIYWSWMSDLNRQPIAYKAIALPIELIQHLVTAEGVEPSNSTVKGW